MIYFNTRLESQNEETFSVEAVHYVINKELKKMPVDGFKVIKQSVIGVIDVFMLFDWSNHLNDAFVMLNDKLIANTSS